MVKSPILKNKTSTVFVRGMEIFLEAPPYFLDQFWGAGTGGSGAGGLC